MYSAEPLPHFVDAYLDYLREIHPTHATFDGIHTHDDLVEDSSRAAVDRHLRELGGYARRLNAIHQDSLTGDEKLERPVLEANIQSRIFELEQIRTWERDPRPYVETLAVSLAAQTLFQYAPATERGRRVVSKLRQTTRVLEAAQANVKEPAGIFVKAAVESARGLASFIERDLPRAFSDVDDLSLLSDLADASSEASTALDRFQAYLDNDLAPRARGSFRLGESVLATKLRLEEGVDVSLERLLDIATRELARAQRAFGEAAARLGPGNPVDVWRNAKVNHPPAGELVATAQSQVEEISRFLARKALVTIPNGEPLVIGPTPRFYRWTFASLWAPGPFESRALPAYYYLTDVDRSWPAEKQDEHLRDFNYGSLWATTMHEAMPGHFLHKQHLKRVESPLRKSNLLAALSFIEGWAHYCEQMMVEEGFGKKDPMIRLGQLSETLIRLARTIVGIRLHAEDLSVEQGVRFFRDEAYLEEASARREAERGTFDPSYVVYALGRLMLLKLRHDCETEQDGSFDLRTFHDALLGNGLLPFAFHRRLMLKDPVGPLLE